MPKAAVRKRKTTYVPRQYWIDQIKLAEERGYLRGVREAQEKKQATLAEESLRVRLKLADSYAEVFKSIATSAVMLFDGGMTTLTIK